MTVSQRSALAGLICLSPILLSAAENRIHVPVDSSRLTRLSGHVAPQATARADRGPLDPAAELTDLALMVKPAAGLEQLLADQRDPASPNFRRWLTPEQFGDRFGLSSADFDAISAWLRSQGLRVGPSARGRHWLSFSGNADRVNRAFRTELRRYQTADGIRYANATEPSIPEALAGIVEAVQGLNDFAPRPHSIVPMLNSGGLHYLSPEDFATIYNLKPLYDAGFDGSGQSVVVIGQSAIDLADIRTFRTTFGLPPSDPQLVLFGSNPGQRSGDIVEASLDIEWAGATAPGARVIYAYATSVTTALLNAIDRNLGPVITMSYGGCEQAFSPTWRYAIQQANAQGITVLVSSGDAGAATCDFTAPIPQAAKGATVSWPSGIPEITAVGGTQFEEAGGSYWSPVNSVHLGSALGYIPEAAWNDSSVRGDLSATAGGASALYAKPSWQFGAGVPNDNARDVPDISFSSSVQHVSYWVISQGRTLHIGGTSAASPAFAGALAVLTQYLLVKEAITAPGLGNINPMLYRLSQTAPVAFHDVTTGDNRVPCAQSTPRCTNGLVGFDAAPGYDLATGLGSADLYELFTRWNVATGTKLTVTSSSQNPGLDDTVQITATIQAGGSGTPTGTVTFTTSLGLLGTATVATANGIATATISAQAVLFPSANGLVSAVYSGDRLFDGAAGSTTVKVALPRTGSVVIPTISPIPVYQVGTTWPYTIVLTEVNGVATRLTGFTVDGVVNPVSFFGSGQITAKGSVSAGLSGSIASAPQDRVFVFTGRDDDGTTWTRRLTIPFVGRAGPPLTPTLTLDASPSSVQQNTAASVDCQWSHQLTVSEQSGFAVQLTRLTSVGSDDLSQPPPADLRNHPPGAVRQPHWHRLLGPLEPHPRLSDHRNRGDGRVRSRYRNGELRPAVERARSLFVRHRRDHSQRRRPRFDGYA